MEWTDICFTVDKAHAETAGAIAVFISGSGIYIEDYSDLAIEAPQIAPVDFIADELLQKANDDVRIHFYLPKEQNVAECTTLLQARLVEAGIPHTLKTASLQQEDWENSWKAYYHPINIGSRLTLCPAWEAAGANGRTVLKLDPGMAFGTGTHETTALCLEVLDEITTPGKTVLDIGCGSGILGIAACLLGAKSALGIDIDPMAVRTANENAKLNGLSGPFTAVEGDLATKAGGRYDIVVANIIASAITALAPAIPPLLNDNGRFISSGIIAEKEASVCAAIEKAGLQVLAVRRRGGWVCIVAGMPQCNPG